MAKNSVCRLGLSIRRDQPGVLSFRRRAAQFPRLHSRIARKLRGVARKRNLGAARFLAGRSFSSCLAVRRGAASPLAILTPAPGGCANAQRFAGGSVRLQPRDRAIVLDSASAAGFPAPGRRSFSSCVATRRVAASSLAIPTPAPGGCANAQRFADGSVRLQPRDRAIVVESASAAGFPALGGRSFSSCVATRRGAASSLAILTPAPGGCANAQRFAGGSVRLQPHDRAIVVESASAAGFPALGGRSFSSDIKPRSFCGALAPEEAVIQGGAA